MYFYSGLTEEERRMVNAASGGNIKNKTLAEAFEFFSKLAEGSRQFSQRTNGRQVKAASSSREDMNVKNELAELKDMMKKMMLNELVAYVLMLHTQPMLTLPYKTRLRM